MELTAEMTVSQLKSRIQDMEGLPPDQQRLIASGRQLEDTQCLFSYLDQGVDLGKICIILRIKGC